MAAVGRRDGGERKEERDCGGWSGRGLDMGYRSNMSVSGHAE